MAILDLEEELRTDPVTDCTHMPFPFHPVPTSYPYLGFWEGKQMGIETAQHTTPAPEALPLPSPFQQRAMTLNSITTVHWSGRLRRDRDRQHKRLEEGKSRWTERKMVRSRKRRKKRTMGDVPCTVWGRYKRQHGRW